MPDLSDHAPLGMTVQCDGVPWIDVGKRDKGKTPPTGNDSHNIEILKANWTETEKQQYFLYMGGETSKNDGRNIMKKLEVTTTQTEMDEINEKINELIRTGMKEACNVRVVRKPTRRTHLRDSNKPWFTQKCVVLKKRLRKWGTALSNTKQKPLPAFYGIKKEYKNEKKRAEKEYKNAIHARIATSKNRNPKMWWELLRKLNGAVDRKRLPPIELNVWADHFNTLLNDQKSTAKGCKTGKYYAAEKDISEEMRIRSNGEVKAKEITAAVHRLDGHKATFFDGVPNEGIKGLYKAQPEVLQNLFTKIMAAGYVPKMWGEAYLKPLYKKGDRTNPSNYRGIAISPCMGKVSIASSILDWKRP